MAVTASTMILEALRKNGKKELGASLSTTEQTIYLSLLNAFLEGLSLERLMVPYLVTESFSLTSSDGEYTIGPSGDFSTTRPIEIVQAWIRDAEESDTPVGVIGAATYNSFVLKTVDGTYPRYLYYQATSPLGVLKLYPEPAASLSLVISSWKPLQNFGGIDVPLHLPPGYQRFIEFNFAIESASANATLPAAVLKGAIDSKAALKRHNLPDTFLQMDAGLVGTHSAGANIFTGP